MAPKGAREIHDVSRCRWLPLQAEYLNPPVLPEVMIEGERPRHLTRIEDGERDGIT
jgi:hypothetical protein